MGLALTPPSPPRSGEREFYSLRRVAERPPLIRINEPPLFDPRAVASQVYSERGLHEEAGRVLYCGLKGADVEFRFVEPRGWKIEYETQHYKWYCHGKHCTVPGCSRQRGYQAAREVAKALRRVAPDVLARGNRFFLLTLTTPHTEGEGVKAVLARIQDQFADLLQEAKFETWRTDWGCIWILEVKYPQHAHYHLVIEADVDERALHVIRKLWRRITGVKAVNADVACMWKYLDLDDVENVKDVLREMSLDDGYLERERWRRRDDEKDGYDELAEYLFKGHAANGINRLRTQQAFADALRAVHDVKRWRFTLGSWRQRGAARRGAAPDGCGRGAASAAQVPAATTDRDAPAANVRPADTAVAQGIDDIVKKEMFFRFRQRAKHGRFYRDLASGKHSIAVHDVHDELGVAPPPDERCADLAAASAAAPAPRRSATAATRGHGLLLVLLVLAAVALRRVFASAWRSMPRWVRRVVLRRARLRGRRLRPARAPPLPFASTPVG